MYTYIILLHQKYIRVCSFDTLICWADVAQHSKPQQLAIYCFLVSVQFGTCLWSHSHAGPIIVCGVTFITYQGFCYTKRRQPQHSQSQSLLLSECSLSLCSWCCLLVFFSHQFPFLDDGGYDTWRCPTIVIDEGQHWLGAICNGNVQLCVIVLHSAQWW